MKIWVVATLFILLMVGSASALGNNKIGYTEYVGDPGANPFDYAPLDREPAASQEFEVANQFTLSTPSQFSDNVQDYYRTFLYSEQPRRVNIAFGCCHCQFSLNDERLTPWVDQTGVDPLGALLGNGQTMLELFLNEGWNEFEAAQFGGGGGGKYVNPCDQEISFPRQTLAEVSDGVSSFPFNCDPSNDCCKADGSDFKPEGALCADEEGQCDGEGRCSDPDSDPAECTEKFGANAFLEFGDNHCCGDDEGDCFSYNSGFFCMPGSGWNPVQPNIGSVFQAGCLGPANAVVSQNGPKVCYMQPPPLDYEFTYVVETAVGDGMWRYYKDGALQPDPIADEDFLDTPFGPGTFTEVKSNVYSPIFQEVQVDIICDQGTEKYVSLNGRKTSLNPGEISSTRIQFNEGVNLLSVACRNDGGGSSTKHIQIRPKLSNFNLMLSARIPEGGMKVSQELSAVLAKKDEPLGDVRDVMPVVGEVSAASQSEIEALLGGSGAPAPEEEEEVVLLDPKFAVIRSSDSNMNFNHTDTDEAGNPIVAPVSGQFRGLYVGPPIPPPYVELARTVINNHGFACVELPGEDLKMIAECAGDPTLNDYYSSQNAMQVEVGDSFKMFNAETALASTQLEFKQHWCSGNGPWVTNMDSRTTGHLTCEAAKDLNGVPMGLEFTGNYCCGEQEGENYNDPFLSGFDKHGACLGSSKVDFGEFPFEDNPESAEEGHLTNNLGVFQMCAPGISPLPGQQRGDQQ